MNCRSCRAKLGARDQKCPSCGRRNPSRELGSGSASEAELAGSGSPLPPVRSLDDTPSPGPRTTRKEAAKPKRPARAEEPETEEPALRLTELVKPEPVRAEARKAETTRGNGASRSGATSSGAPGRDDVRAMVAERPHLIEPGLTLHEEDGDPAGVAYGTPVGEIDLLARDSSSGWVLVVIPEQSREKELIGELLQLMGWVRKHLCQPSQEVRAIALLDWVPEDLGYAAAAVADTVEFKRYQLALTFEVLEV